MKISELYTHLGYWTHRFDQAVRLSFERNLAGYGVTVSQWCFLITLYHDQGNTVKRIAKRIHLDPAAVTRLADRLTDKGFVQRISYPDDGRVIAFILTDKGKEIVPHLAKEADENDKKYFGVLSNLEQQNYISILQKLLKQCGESMETTQSLEAILKNEETLINNDQRSFPELIKVLIDHDVVRYHADLVAHQKTYYCKNNKVSKILMMGDHPQASETFDQTGVINALREIQNGNIAYPEFINRILDSGVVSYTVFIDGAQAHYSGKNGEFYVEHFPANS